MGRLLLNQLQIHIKPNTPHWGRGGGVENNVTWQIVLESQSSKMLGQGIPTIGTSFRRDKYSLFKSSFLFFLQRNLMMLF